ncbi:MAG: cyclic nucleotide-binding domain-containing protein [Ghiorsea sp.]
MTTASDIDNEDFQGSKFTDLRILYPDEFQLLYGAASYQSFKANEPIITEGEASNVLYLVKSGRLLVNKRHDENVYEVGSITAGDVFGEASVLYQSPAGAEVRAVEDCELYTIPSSVVRQLFESNERFLRATTQLAERRAAASALAVNPVFSTLPMAVREVALYNAKFVSVKPTEVIIHEGDEATFMFLILAGSVDISLQHPSELNEKIMVATRASGDELGEIAVITGYPHGATARAVKPVRVLAIRNTLIRAWSERYSDFAYALYGQVYRKLKENRGILSEILDDREARDLTINSLPPFEEYKERNHL